MISYINNGDFYRFVARDNNDGNRFYHAIQGGLDGDLVDYVRVDETLDVTIHQVTALHENGSFEYNPTPVDVHVVWS